MNKQKEEKVCVFLNFVAFCRYSLAFLWLLLQQRQCSTKFKHEELTRSLYLFNSKFFGMLPLKLAVVLHDCAHVFVDVARWYNSLCAYDLLF